MSDELLKHGAISWNELLTTDVRGACVFYTELFGWTAEEMSMDEGMHYTVFKTGDRQVGGMMTLPEEAAQMGAPPHWGSYVTVDDVDAIAAKVDELGGKILVPPTDVPSVGRFTTFQDPQGAVISAITYVPMEECQDSK
jgi:predicted enzyme related to lactoylglutathione lyase